jgi:hypothetical protein
MPSLWTGHLCLASELVGTGFTDPSETIQSLTTHARHQSRIPDGEASQQ